MKRGHSEALKRRVKTLMKHCQYFPVERMETVTGQRDHVAPPRRLIFIGDGDFRKTGKEFLEYFVKLGGAETGRQCPRGWTRSRKNDDTTHLPPRNGTYKGFDIVPARN